jgi:hypothetical protein
MPIVLSSLGNQIELNAQNDILGTGLINICVVMTVNHITRAGCLFRVWNSYLMIKKIN